MKEKNAYTLVELAVVISIVIVLSALIYPTLAEAKKRAYRTACISNLHQLHIAITLYRADQGLESVLGNQMDMGLPSDLSPILAKNPLECRGIDPRTCEGPAFYEHLWPALPSSPGFDQGMTDVYGDFVMKNGEATPLVADPNHQFDCPISALSKVRVIGVNLAGSVTTRIKRGRYWQWSWWLD